MDPPEVDLSRLRRTLTETVGQAMDGWILEDQGLALGRFCSLEAPDFRVQTGPTVGPEVRSWLEGRPTGRVVVKVLSPAIPHRGAAGAVQIVVAETERVERLLEEWLATFAWARPRFLLQTFRPPETNEVEALLGFRHTREFGPVVTVAPGGRGAEALARALNDEAGPIFLASGLGTPTVDEIQALLAARAFLDPLTTGEEGTSPALTRLAEAVRVLTRVAEEAAEVGITELEFNPVRVSQQGLWALDALGRTAEVAAPSGASAEPSPGARDTSSAALDGLLRPRSLAVAGVSAQGMNPGRVLLRNTLVAGFDPAALQVVKPGVEEVDGVRCVARVSQLDPVDVLVVGVPAEQVPDMVEEAVSAGVARAFILISGGLEEGLAQGVPRPADRIRDALGGQGPERPRAVGGNCLGIRSVPGRYDTLFIPAWKLGFPNRPPAPLALVSQSGAFAIARASVLPQVNPRYVVTLGTQLDVTMGEILEHLLTDGELTTAACYVEGFRRQDGLRFLEAAHGWRAAGRRLYLYRAGRSTQGQLAAASHTAALAGDYRLTRSLASRAGVVVLDSVEEMQDQLLLAACLEGRSPGPGWVALSNAGFECVSMADHAGAAQWAPLERSTLEGLDRVLAATGLQGIVAPRNPLDLTPIAGDGPFVEAARLLLSDSGAGVGLVACVPLTPALQTLSPADEHPEDLHRTGALLEGLTTLWRETRTPWAVAVDGGAAFQPLRDALAEAGIPVFTTADRAARALDRWARSAAGGEG